MSRARRATVAVAATAALLGAVAVPAAMASGQRSATGAAAARARAPGAAAPTCSADFYSIHADGANGLQAAQGFPQPLVFDSPDRGLTEFMYGTGASIDDTFTSAQVTIPGTSAPGTVNDSFFSWDGVESDGDHDVFETSSSDADWDVQADQFTAGRTYAAHGTAVDANGATCAFPAHSVTVLSATQVLAVFSGRSGSTVTISPRTMRFELATERWDLAPEPVQLLALHGKQYQVIAHGTTDSNGSITFTVHAGARNSYLVRTVATSSTVAGQSTPVIR